MTTVVLPGSFDPFTLGHLDLTRRATALGHHVIVAVSHNPSKKGLLDLEQRTAAIRAALADEGLAEQAEVRTLPRGLLVDFCREVGADAVVRGLRSQLDLSYEEPMARMNHHLAGTDTVFLLTDQSLAHISSSLVREVHALGGDVSDMLPAASLEALRTASDLR
ncbi:pantetheine-phosphate adenylyltransferase [Brachybacterium sp. HMSC06H03]|uniref:pantetheine-phosphate adenylyltransferase n=1 Tax=Brachybacterium sp. HMSC06H03 TaxID=1581127 RepID=UPI0008A1567B|nr:pantetheine-phosphate adenylyltransferase [Brachybacterium sp. HMSC06H03]OFT65033.1 pantetheine-phosphate adenylyltransferase [Brachybacterium sp. HMSC06H03]